MGNPISSICPIRPWEPVSERGTCGGRGTGRDTGCDMGRWREVCINMGSAPPFEFVFTAIPVDRRIENSDNVPKGFYGAAPGPRKGPRKQTAVGINCSDDSRACSALKPNDSG